MPKVEFFNVMNISFSAVRGNKVLANISEFTAYYYIIDRYIASGHRPVNRE